MPRNPEKFELKEESKEISEESKEVSKEERVKEAWDWLWRLKREHGETPIHGGEYIRLTPNDKMDLVNRSLVGTWEEFENILEKIKREREKKIEAEKTKTEK